MVHIPDSTSWGYHCLILTVSCIIPWSTTYQEVNAVSIILDNLRTWMSSVHFQLHPCSCVKRGRWDFAVCLPVCTVVFWALIRTAYWALPEHSRTSLVNTATLFSRRWVLNVSELWCSNSHLKGITSLTAPASIFRVSQLPATETKHLSKTEYGREIYSVSSFQSFQSVMQRSWGGWLTSWLTESRKDKCPYSLALVSLLQWDGATNMQLGASPPN